MAATEAFVFDAIRTPRGKGKSNGSLHGTKPVDLVVGLMHEMLVRNVDLDPRPGRRRRARLRLAGRRPGRGHRQDRRDQGRAAGHRRRRAAQPLLRLRPRGREHRRAEGRLRLGGPRLRRRRRVDVARADGLRRRRLGDGPRDQLRHVLRPAGHRRRPDRDGRGLLARRRRRLRRPLAAARRRRAGEGRFAKLASIPVKDINEHVVLDHDEFIRPGTTVETLGRPQALVRGDGRDGRLRRRGAAEVPLGREDRPRPHAGQLVGHRRRRVAASRSATRRPARSSASSRGRASSPPRSPAPTRRSCSPAPRPRPRRRSRRPA